MNIRKTAIILTLISGIGMGFSAPSQAGNRGHSSSTVTFVTDGAIIRLGDYGYGYSRNYCPPKFYGYRDNYYGYYDNYYDRGRHHHNDRHYRHRKDVKKHLHTRAHEHHNRRHHRDH